MGQDVSYISSRNIEFSYNALTYFYNKSPKIRKRIHNYEFLQMYNANKIMRKDKKFNYQLDEYWVKNISKFTVLLDNEYTYVIKSKLLNLNIVIKTAKDTTLAIEYFIGVYGANKLYKMGNLNFTRIYNYLECGAVKNGKICENTSKTSFYIIYEYIEGITLKNFIETCTEREVYMYFLQICLSLRHANQEIDFTHYDLHYSNIIMYKHSNIPFNLNYISSSEKNISCKSDGYIAKFIDYGRSHIKYENNDYGYSSIDRNIFCDRSFILYDIYKILCSIFSIRKEILILLKYFNPKINEEDFKKQEEYYHALPYCPSTTGINKSEWNLFCHEYILGNDYDKMFETLPKYNIDEFIKLVIKVIKNKFNENFII